MNSDRDHFLAMLGRLDNAEFRIIHLTTEDQRDPAETAA